MFRPVTFHNILFECFNFSYRHCSIFPSANSTYNFFFFFFFTKCLRVYDRHKDKLFLKSLEEYIIWRENYIVYSPREITVSVYFAKYTSRSQYYVENICTTLNYMTPTFGSLQSSNTKNILFWFFMFVLLFEHFCSFKRLLCSMTITILMLF